MGEHRKGMLGAERWYGTAATGRKGIRRERAGAGQQEGRRVWIDSFSQQTEHRWVAR